MIKKILQLVFGTGLGQLIQLSALPVLALHYSPNDFGFYFLVVSVSTLAAVVATLQLQHAITVCTEDTQVRDILSALKVNLLLSGALSGLLLVYGLISSDWLPFACMLASLLVGVSAVVRSILVWRGHFKGISRGLVIRAVSIVAVQFAMAFVWEQGLVAGLLAGELMAIIFFLVVLNEPSMFSGRIHFRDFMPLLRKYSHFSLMGTAQELMSLAALNLPIILIPIYWGAYFAGQFGMAQRFVMPPAAVVLGAIVSYIQYAYGKRERWALFDSRFVNPLVLMPVFAAFAVMLFGSLYVIEPYVQINDWGDSVWTAKYICLWAVVLVGSSPYRAACRIYGMQYIQFAVDMVIVLLILGLFFVGNDSFSYRDMARGLAGIGVMQNVALASLVWLKFKLSSRQEAI
ncbi:hypothetical protein MWU49_03810 [Alcanivorax sp. S6407]|uniref:lipopolysaccharide biosynthesis protein n=1 Tax=Alcanivorax sp. S6407 TaxID=2926424 RepID=UPI001FF1FB72|nr:hypothetical protein [Alcanivorax sp. S6407]MCK0152816.1 hypothetical protein [Alcanivorax sp. S6407]